MVIVGFDWARDKHDVCIQTPDGRILFAGVVKHDLDALNKLSERLAELEPHVAQIHVALEQHDGALLAWLLESGFTVYGINPKSSDRARDVFRPAGGKDDRTDAQVVSDLLRSNIGRFKPMHAQSDETLRLRALARLRTRVNAQKGVGLQRLRTLLAEWCPAMSHLCTDLNRKWQRRLLEHWALHEDLVGAHGNALNSFFSNNRICAATREKVKETRAMKPLFIPAGRKEPLRFEIALILEQIKLLIAKIGELDEELDKAFASHASFNVFHSLPVKGVPTLAMISSAFGDRRDDPSHWRQLAARWGVAPVTYASGKSRSVRRRRACDTHVLQSLTDLAFTTCFSVSGCWARPFYERKRKEGRDHHEALRAVALRWVKIMWTMWRKGTLYDEEYHRTNATAKEAKHEGST